MVLKETFYKLKSGLTKTRESIVGKINQIASSKSKIDEELLEQLEEILIVGDVGVETTNYILTNLKSRVKEEKYQSSNELLSLLQNEVTKIIQCDVDYDKSILTLPKNIKPYVIMVVGVNGVGKTTTIGKLAYQYKLQNYKVTVGAADTFRAAANEQLEIWAKRAGVNIVQQSQGADPAAVAYDTLNSALSKGSDVVIIDTAGRLHTKKNLMEELKKIKRVLGKCLASAPHDVFLVLDATTGQNGLQQVRYFTEVVDVTGLILTKLDGTAKGGVILSIINELKIPVKFIGVGEQIDDLQIFDPHTFVDALFEGKVQFN